MGWWRRYLEWRQRNIRCISLLPDGSSTRCRGVESVIRWDDVTSIRAFKRDLLTMDVICLLVSSHDSAAEVNEDDSGYGELEQEMARRLDISPEWKLAVIAPPFETNATEIFSGSRGAWAP